MMVPTNRLIVWTALTAIPFTVAWLVAPAVSVAAILLFLVIVMFDSLLSFNILHDVTASLPNIIRLTKERRGEILIDITNESAKASQITIGLNIPQEIFSENLFMSARLPQNSQHAQVAWPCTALKRGKYNLENVYFEKNSPLGFWAIRKTSAANAEIRVYPNLMREKKHLAAFFLNRGVLGLHAQRQVGKGREFEKLREYIHGDSFEDIHWKATAKRNRPITKIFQIEKTQEVYVVIDSSRLSARTVKMEPINSKLGKGQLPLVCGSVEAPPTTQLERFITAAMVMGLVAEKQGDLFGIVSFSDTVDRFLRAKNGQAHYGICRDLLYMLEPKTVNPDFGEVCAFIRTRLRRRSLILFLTNLDDPVIAETFEENIKLLSNHHLVLVNMMTSPGIGQLFSKKHIVDSEETKFSVYQRLAGHIQWQRLEELRKVLKQMGVSMSLLENESMCAQMVSQYINVKRRQAL